MWLVCMDKGSGNISIELSSYFLNLFLFASHLFTSTFFPGFVPQRAIEKEVELISGYTSAARPEPLTGSVPITSVPTLAQ